MYYRLKKHMQTRTHSFLCDMYGRLQVAPSLSIGFFSVVFFALINFFFIVFDFRQYLGLIFYAFLPMALKWWKKLLFITINVWLSFFLEFIVSSFHVRYFHNWMTLTYNLTKSYHYAKLTVRYVLIK